MFYGMFNVFNAGISSFKFIFEDHCKVKCDRWWGISNSKVSSGSVLGTNPKITQVKVYLNVASGTDPFDLYIESPEGTVARLTPSTKSRTYYVTDFVCENPKGDWYLQIENLGKTYDPNKLYPASTVTATITVTYSY